MSDASWNEGLKFECARCSACCRFEPGLVLLSRNDLRRLTDHLGLDFKSFFTNYCRLVPFGGGTTISLRETGAFDCIFWKNGCSIYEARPVQCRTYPFWTGLADSWEAWTRESRRCPGIGRGKALARREIEEALWEYRRNAPILLDPRSDRESLDEGAILGG